MTEAGRILVFGGTFDPPHLAHVVLPPLVARSLGCDRLMYVPAAISPHKVDAAPTDAAHRVAMLRLALQDVPEAEICTLEIDRGGTSYTVETLESLAAANRGAELFLLIGSDQAKSFHRWKEPGRVLALATVIVMLRPPDDGESLSATLAAHWSSDEVDHWRRRVIDLPQLPISATSVRRSNGSANPAAMEAVPEAVRTYIIDHGLYASDARL